MRQATCATCARVFDASQFGRTPKFCTDCRPYAKPLTPNRTHGKWSTFSKCGCRCEPCVEAGRAHYARKPKRPRVPKPKAQNECVQCGKRFEAYRSWQKCCSKRCTNRADIERRPEQRCELCGASFHQTNGLRKEQRFCSKSCAAKQRKPKPKVLSGSCRVYIIDCDICGATFTARSSTTKRCSDTCRLAHQSAKVMRFYKAAYTTGRVKVAMFWRKELIQFLRDRDGDICGICNTPVSFLGTTGPRGTNPLGATIDHIHPSSLGGGDEFENLRLTHWRCNNRRGNRVA